MPFAVPHSGARAILKRISRMPSASERVRHGCEGLTLATSVRSAARLLPADIHPASPSWTCSLTSRSLPARARGSACLRAPADPHWCRMRDRCAFLIAGMVSAALAIAGCRSKPATRQKADAPEPPPSASAPSASTQAPVDGGAATEATTFSLACAWSSRFETAFEAPSGPPRACMIRGRVRAARAVVLTPDRQARARRALELRIEPDDAIPCRTPFDPSEKELRLPEADYPDLDRAGLVVVLGGARLVGALREGARLCGWAHAVAQPGLYYPRGWEGELADASGKLLAAWSFSFDRASSVKLARAFRFSREGPAERIPIEEGGAFVRHHRVRVYHGGASALSVDGDEAILRGRDGTFAVQAVSDLTEGHVPIFVGHHDGFGFAAVRVGDSGG